MPERCKHVPEKCQTMRQFVIDSRDFPNSNFEPRRKQTNHLNVRLKTSINDAKGQHAPANSDVLQAFSFHLIFTFTKNTKNSVLLTEHWSRVHFPSTLGDEWSNWNTCSPIRTKIYIDRNGFTRVWAIRAFSRRNMCELTLFFLRSASLRWCEWSVFPCVAFVHVYLFRKRSRTSTTDAATHVFSSVFQDCFSLSLTFVLYLALLRRR